MSARNLVIVVCVMVCLGTVTGVVMQGTRIGRLRAEQRRLLIRSESAFDESVPASPEISRTDYSPPPELLQLRDQVNRLTLRKRELAEVTNENEELRAQLAARATNIAPLPPDYLRRSQARMAGYNTPEATMESFLWAARNRDLVNLFQAMTPESAERLRQRQQSLEQFIEQMSTLPGMRVLERQPQQDGSIRLKVEIVPGGPGDEYIYLRQIAGQWKIDFEGL